MVSCDFRVLRNVWSASWSLENHIYGCWKQRISPSLAHLAMKKICCNLFAVDYTNAVTHIFGNWELGWHIVRKQRRFKEWHVSSHQAWKNTMRLTNGGFMSRCFEFQYIFNLTFTITSFAERYLQCPPSSSPFNCIENKIKIVIFWPIQGFHFVVLWFSQHSYTIQFLAIFLDFYLILENARH